MDFKLPLGTVFYPGFPPRYVLLCQCGFWILPPWLHRGYYPRSRNPNGFPLAGMVETLPGNHPLKLNAWAVTGAWLAGISLKKCPSKNNKKTWFPHQLPFEVTCDLVSWGQNLAHDDSHCLAASKPIHLVTLHQCHAEDSLRWNPVNHLPRVAG